MFTTAVIVTLLSGLFAGDAAVSRLPERDILRSLSVLTDASEPSDASPHGDASGATIGMGRELLGDVRDDKRTGRRSDSGGAAESIGHVAAGRRMDARACFHRAASSPATLQSAGVRLQI